MTSWAEKRFRAAQIALDRLVIERLTYPRSEYVRELRQAIQVAADARRCLAVYARWTDLDREPRCP